MRCSTRIWSRYIRNEFVDVFGQNTILGFLRVAQLGAIHITAVKVAFQSYLTVLSFRAQLVRMLMNSLLKRCAKIIKY